MLLAQSYYPLSLSNSWFYDSSSSAVRVTKDSLFPNGHRYFVLSNPDLAHGTYLRVDSQYVYYFNSQNLSDVPFFRLNSAVGDTTFTQFFAYYYVILTKIDTQSVFGHLTRVLTFKLDGLEQTQISLSEKYGLLSGWYYGDPPGPWPYAISNLTGCVIDGVSFGTVVSVRENEFTPNEFALEQNYPNPFNSETIIKFSVSQHSHASLVITDILGRRVRTLVNNEQTSGIKSIRWDGKNDEGFLLPSGIYFYSLHSAEAVISRRMVFLK